ncbi:hypothetical protein [Hyalangium sp.]|uniref:hypothetical protein n=1 Tax=Hyalangium sp. TaxID=2028555 RepID=UPI002D478A3F|nr:hypothetical protein [Hyalangium sp.]HYH97418.1 hypothetical protein [Hyalangium sp.]
MRRAPESGCLQLHPAVTATLNDIPLPIPSDFPTGSTVVSARASNIPAERCEGVATCTANSLLVYPRVVELTVQP